MIRFFLNKIVNRSISSIVLFAFLLLNFFYPIQTFALTSGPSQPELTQFEPAGSSEMVNVFTGDFSYNIPLLDIEGYPVNIAYNGNPKMDQEASWVGLGWNINPGVVNRSLRGLPDDFKGDIIQRRIAMRDYKTYGGLTGFAMEVAGYDGKLGFNMAIASGSSYNNYKGWGGEIATDLGLAANMQKEGGSNSLSAGIGLSFKASSFDGVEFAPYAGIRAAHSKASETSSGKGASIGVNYSPSINSRSGVWNQTWNMSVALQNSGPGVTTKSGGTRSQGMGIGTNFSMTNLGSSTAFLPQIPFNTKSTAWSLDLKIGGGSCIFAAFGSVRGYYSNTSVKKNDASYSGYGYLNEESANDESSLLDFSREKDGTTYKESTHLPLTSHNFDMYAMSAQGMMGVFRAHRNDIGTVYDVRQQSNSNNNAVGAEIAFGDGVNVGVNYIGTFSKESSGLWKSATHAASKFSNISSTNTKTSSPTYSEKEGIYHSFAGEKTISDQTHKTIIGGDSPVKAELIKESSSTYQASDYYESVGSSNPISTSAVAFGSGAVTRKPRDRNISMLNALKAKNYGIEKKIRNYTLNSFALTNGNVTFNTSNDITRDAVLSSLSNIDHRIADHTSEITSTDIDGSRYVYGIPVYNYYNKDVTFSTEQTPSNGVVTYAPGTENAISSNPGDGNNKGKEGYLEASIMPSYAHSYLLSSVLSTDFVDLTDDGPTADDYGSYVKYNYSKAGDYAWRIPASGTQTTAIYNDGFYSDPDDNKASYSYGVKQNWYLHSIETKNFVAFFEMSDRHDNLGVDVDLAPTLQPFNAESSKTTSSSTSSKAKKLDKIILYNKQDIINSGSVANATPIKTVFFQYDYSLCQGVPNNDLGTGKLTLKKLWFTYGKSPTTKSTLSPYEFAYNDQVDHNFVEDTGSDDANPSYNFTCIDRWGNYKPQPGGSLDNVKFPYVDQVNTTVADRNRFSRSWCLNTIKTPSGGLIKVDYEADDYSHIMAKRAGQMVKLLGFAKTLGGGIAGAPTNHWLYNSVDDPLSYAVVDITNIPSGYKDVSGNDIPGIPGSFSSGQALDFVNKNYLDGLNGHLFFKVKVDLLNGSKSEFIPGYADIISATPINTGATANYDRIYIQVKTPTIGDKKYSSKKTNPVTKAALQMGRRYLQDIMYGDKIVKGSMPSPIQSIMQLSGMIDDALALIGGQNKKFIDRGFCRDMDPDQSFVRLTNPNQKKIGGGNRVKKITVSDSWNDMISSEASHAYSQKYDYTTTDESTGNSISTGVASYEPLLGGDENSHRYPVTTPYASNLSVNDELFIEHPIGESLLPDATVGYSKVTVTNEYDTPGGKTVTKHGTGKTEYCFFTTKDFPYIFDETVISKQPVQPKKIAKLLKLKSKEKLYATQGYVVKLNDMHGKPKSVKNYAEGQLGAISGINYEYKRNGGELNNNVNVIDAKNTITNEEVGVDVDIINDSRMGKSKMQTFSISANIASFYCSYYIPLVFLWPGYSKLENEFYSVATTKTVYKYGILDKITAFDNKSEVSTENLLYDKQTGQLVLSKTNNQFEDPVYTMNYPAHWSYNGMGQAYKNSNLRLLNINAAQLINSSGRLVSTIKSLLSPGDEIAVHNATQIGSNYTEGTSVGKYWVVEDLNSSSADFNYYFLLDKNGAKASLTPSGNYIFEVIRSGRKNLQNTSIGSMTSLKDPQNNSVSPTSLNISASTKVINSNAIEYDEKWNYYATHAEAKESVTSCTPVTTSDYALFQKLFNCYLATPTHAKDITLNIDGDKLMYMGTYTYTPKPVSYTGGFTLSEFNYMFGPSVFNMSTTFLNESGYSPPCGRYPYQVVSAHIKWYTSPNRYRVNLYSEWWKYSCAAGDYLPVIGFSPQAGTCGIELTPSVSISPSSDPTTVVSISGFGPAGPAYANNQFSVNINAGVGNSHSGVYIGTIPCLNILSGYNCNTSACANASGNLNPYFQNMRGQWQPKRSYNYLEDRTQAGVQAGGIMKGDLRDDGTYANYIPFWNYNSTISTWEPIYKLSSQTTDPAGLYNKWIMNSEVNKIDKNGNVLQSQNTLRQPSAALYGYDFTRVTANASNALYTDIANDNFEDYGYVREQCIEHFKFYDNKLQVTNQAAHTGKYSLALTNAVSARVKGTMNSFNTCNYVDNQNIVAYSSGNFNTYYNLGYDSYTPASSGGLYGIKSCDLAGRFGPLHSYSSAKTYVMSFWVKEENPFGPVIDYTFLTGVFKLNGTTISGTPKKSSVIDGWQKFDYEFTIPASTSPSYLWEVNLSTTWPFKTYIDDFRIHPYNANMSTSVYDPHSLRLWAQLDERNFASLYEYDEEGVLVRVKKETDKGVRTVKEVRSALYRR